MNIPGDLKYTKNDEWIKVEGSTATIGISDYAQDQLSDVVYLEYAASEGEDLAQGDIFGTVESVKAASDMYIPISGKITATNEALLDTPEMVNTDPYGGAWMIKVEVSDPSQLDELLDAAAYEAFLKERDA